MRKLSMGMALLVGLVAIMACVTVNIYFPAGEMQEVAKEIVDEVRQEQAEKKKQKDGLAPRPAGLRLAGLVEALGVRQARAQVNINISTPAIRALRSALSGRFNSLRPYYAAGALGENNRGYVEIRDTGGLNLKDKARARKLVDAENRDRSTLYREILRANNLGAQFMGEVERIFANSWRGQNVVPGSWVQNDDGSWARR